MFDDQYWRASPSVRAGVRLTGPSRWTVRRHARRHGQPTLGDLVAYWRAQRLGRRCLRGGSGWPPRLRIVLVLTLLTAGMVVGVFFT